MTPGRLLQLAFLVGWATVGGLASGLGIGLFMIVLGDGKRKGIIP
jgi:hypothetical protein